MWFGFGRWFLYLVGLFRQMTSGSAWSMDITHPKQPQLIRTPLKTEKKHTHHNPKDRGRALLPRIGDVTMTSKSSLPLFFASSCPRFGEANSLSSAQVERTVQALRTPIGAREGGRRGRKGKNGGGNNVEGRIRHIKAVEVARWTPWRLTLRKLRNC